MNLPFAPTNFNNHQPPLKRNHTHTHTHTLSLTTPASVRGVLFPHRFESFHGLHRLKNLGPGMRQLLHDDCVLRVDLQLAGVRHDAGLDEAFHNGLVHVHSLTRHVVDVLTGLPMQESVTDCVREAYLCIGETERKLVRDLVREREGGRGERQKKIDR